MLPITHQNGQKIMNKKSGSHSGGPHFKKWLIETPQSTLGSEEAVNCHHALRQVAKLYIFVTSSYM